MSACVVSLWCVLSRPHWLLSREGDFICGSLRGKRGWFPDMVVKKEQVARAVRRAAADRAEEFFSGPNPF